MALRTTRQMIEVLGTSNSGETRVTRQTVAVLGTGTGLARVHRQAIEVLVGEAAGTEYAISAENEVALSGEAGAGFVWNVDADTDLVFSHEAYLNLEGYGDLSPLDCEADYDAVLGRSAESTLAIGHDPDVAVVYSRSTSSSVALAQELEYVGPKEAAAENALTFDQTGYLCQTYETTSGTSIEPASTAEVSGTIRASASNTLVLLSLADNKVFIRDVVTQLNVSVEADYEYAYAAENTIELTSTAYQGQLFVTAVSQLEMVTTARTNPLTIGPGPDYDFDLPGNTIEFTQEATSSIRMLSAETAVSLEQSFDVWQPWYVEAVTELQTVTKIFDPETMTFVDVISGLDSSTSVNLATATPRPIQHYLQLTHAAKGVVVRSDAIGAAADNALTIESAAHTNVTASSISYLPLTIEAIADVCVPASVSLDLNQSALRAITRALTAESSLSFAQGVSFFIGNNPALFDYAPFIGEGASDDPDPPPATLSGPIAGVTVPFQLLYPPAGEITDSVTLRAPNLGNKDRLGFNRVLRETRGGTLVVYADQIWPKIQTLVLSFSGLSEAEKNGFLAFVEDHLGFEVGLLDWEHRYWKGIIMTPDEPVVQDDRDTYSFSFEFEGELDPQWTPP